MIKFRVLGAATCFLTLFAANASEYPPLSLHPENPRYFQWRDKPAILVTSGEHYGALLNADFDFEPYFATLAKEGFNLTRLFSGAYCEQVGAFKITRNTLAPTEGKFVAPWARSETPGYANGGTKFDLKQWNPAYFERLHALLKSASKHGVVVEFVFFCPFYKDDMWKLSPLNPGNHIDPLAPPKTPNDIWSLDKSGPFLAVQEALVRKIAVELNGYDNLYFEVCNEPYMGPLPQDWHDHIAQTIVDAEKDLPNQHLISWNVANHGKNVTVKEPLSAYSIFNFHYSSPPVEVANNWHLNKPIGDNETGFDGQENRPYRTEAWEFLLAGGALFNHLDYSFAAGGQENGTFAYPEAQPGGGNVPLRKQFAALKRTIEMFDISKLTPIKMTELVHAGIPEKASSRALQQSGKGWLVYVSDIGGANRQLDLKLNLPEGSYQFHWIDPVLGSVVRSDNRSHDGKGLFSIQSPKMAEDLAVQITIGD